MKKLVLLATLMAAFGVASAVEVGVNGSIDNYSDKDRSGAGLTVGQHFGKFSITTEADREIKRNLDKFSGIAGYDVVTLGTATLTGKAGVTYLYDKSIKQGGCKLPFARMFGKSELFIYDTQFGSSVYVTEMVLTDEEIEGTKYTPKPYFVVAVGNCTPGSINPNVFKRPS